MYSADIQLHGWYKRLNIAMSECLGMHPNVERGAFICRYWSSVHRLRVFRIWPDVTQWCEFTLANYPFWPTYAHHDPQRFTVYCPIHDGWIGMYLNDTIKARGKIEYTLNDHFLAETLFSVPFQHFPGKQTEHERELLSLSFETLKVLKKSNRWDIVKCAEMLFMSKAFSFGIFQSHIKEDVQNNPMLCLHSNDSFKMVHDREVPDLSDVSLIIAMADLFLQKYRRGEPPLDVFDYIKRLPAWKSRLDLVTAFQWALLNSSYVHPLSKVK